MVKKKSTMEEEDYVELGGRRYWFAGDYVCDVPRAEISHVSVSDLPKDLMFFIIKSVTTKVIECEHTYFPKFIQRTAKDKVLVVFGYPYERKFWPGAIALDLYMECAKSLVEQRAATLGDVSHVWQEGNLDVVEFYFDVMMQGATVGQILDKADQLIEVLFKPLLQLEAYVAGQLARIGGSKLTIIDKQEGNPQ